jgi:hypothetical protein
VSALSSDQIQPNSPPKKALTTIGASIWGLGMRPRAVAYLRGCVAFRRVAAMASTSSSCPAATLITKS